MANAISTNGIKLKYIAETTHGTKPTSGYTVIPGVVSIPGITQAPEMLDCTELSETKQKQVIPGLMGAPEAIGVVFNNIDANETAWTTLVSAYNTAATSNLDIWFEIAVPNHKSYYFTGIPSALSFNGAESNQVLQQVGYVTPTCNVQIDTASTT